MNGWVIVGGWWWRVFPRSVQGMALFPFILLRNSPRWPRLLRHERIHLRQQAELLILPFYVWYLVAYLWHRRRLGDHDAAYRALSFEHEAYARDRWPRYLDNRPFWAFLNHLSR